MTENGRASARRGAGVVARLGPSGLILTALLVAATLGAASLARQSIIIPPPPPPPASWSSVGYDNARSGHSRSFGYRANAPITLRWRITIDPPGGVAGQPVMDGSGNTYIAERDGAVLTLNADGKTLGCAALQPITDTSCTGSVSVAPSPPLGGYPHALAGPDGAVYVVSASGDLIPFVLSPGSPLSGETLQARPVIATGLEPSAGLAASKTQLQTSVKGIEPYDLYGVVSLGARRFAVAAFDQKGVPLANWIRTPIATRRLGPISVAPDGTLLTTASSPFGGGAARLYALRTDGSILWSRALAPGNPSYAAIDGADMHWLAWVAGAANSDSWVAVVDATGRLLWRWIMPCCLIRTNDDVPAGVALAHPLHPNPMDDARAFVAGDAGVYLLDLPRRQATLFLNARVSGAPGPLTLDQRDFLYVPTSTGHIYDLWTDGRRDRVRWRYDTGRDARYTVELYPSTRYPSDKDAVLIVSHDRLTGGDVVESLGGGGEALATVEVPTPTPTATAVNTPTPTTASLACAPIDCPTPTPTASPTASPTVTPTITATALPTATPTALSTATPTITPTSVIATPSPPSLTVTATPATPLLTGTTPVAPPSIVISTPTLTSLPTVSAG